MLADSIGNGTRALAAQNRRHEAWSFVLAGKVQCCRYNQRFGQKSNSDTGTLILYACLRTAGVESTLPYVTT